MVGTQLANTAGWAAVAIFSAFAIWFDLRARRVPNWLVLAGLALAAALIGLCLLYTSDDADEHRDV